MGEESLMTIGRLLASECEKMLGENPTVGLFKLSEPEEGLGKGAYNGEG